MITEILMEMVKDVMTEYILDRQAIYGVCMVERYLLETKILEM